MKIIKNKTEAIQELTRISNRTNSENSSQLLKSYLKHPLMTIKIISAIHFEAFKLWMKGIKIIKKKIKMRNNITVEN